MSSAAALLTHETGVLAAATAFGKTVVAAKMIAARERNTLVLVHRRQLLDQWVARLQAFLDIAPGSLGVIHGGKKTPTGIIDIALMQSLVRRGVVSDLVADYGHVVVDECHHLSAVGFEAIARAAKARSLRAATGTGATGVAWPQLSAIALGITLIAIADLAGDFIRAAGLTGLGIAAFLFALRLDVRGTVRLFPSGSGDLRTVHGAGYATLFLYYLATMGLIVYGPAVLQTLRGLSALAAGYVVSSEAFFWTAIALPVAGLTGEWPKRLIRLGAVAILAGLTSCALVFDGGSLVFVVLAGGLTGIGFGLSYAFITQGILGALPGEERAIGGAGIATARLAGAAAGSAMAAAIANLAGFAHGFTPPAAQAAGIWVFVAALPAAALACVTAWQMAGPATSPATVPDPSVK